MSYSPQNVSNMPPPISMTDQAFIEKLSEGVGRIQLARFMMMRMRMRMRLDNDME